MISSLNNKNGKFGKCLHFNNKKTNKNKWQMAEVYLLHGSIYSRSIKLEIVN